MNINVERFTVEAGVMIIEAEGVAETYQLASLLEALKKAGVAAEKWDDMEGRKGITIRLQNAKT